MSKAREITNELVTERTARALRRYVGRGKEYSYDEFAELVACDRRTVESWCRGETAPCAYKLARCMAVLPPAFANSFIETAGLTGAHDVEGERPNGFALNASVAELLHAIADALGDDGQIDHQEDAQIEPLARNVVDLLNRRTALRKVS